MSDTVPVPTTSSPAHVNTDIGMSPLLFSFLVFLAVGPGAGLLGLLLAVSSQEGAILFVIGAIPWAIASMITGIKFAVSLLSGGGAHFRRTKAALREGRVGLSYYVRSATNDDVIVVDESRRLLCVNGDVIDFAKVKHIHWHSQGDHQRLEFTLASGDHPLKVVNLGDESRMRTAFARLCNTLDFTI